MPDSYEKLMNAKEVYTFRDFILLPGLSVVEPYEVKLSSRFSRNLNGINLPLVSSPMDTVTEATLAIALARQGGIGVIHRNMAVEEQVENVKKVKRAESFIIRDVFTAAPDETVSNAVTLMKKYSISGLPVVQGGRLVGIVTKRDINFAVPTHLIENYMTKEVVTAGPDVTIEEAKKIMHMHRIEKLPVVGANGELLGLITIKDIYSREKFSLASRDKEGRLLVAAAVSPFDLDRAKSLDKYVDALVSDVAHFHNENILRAAAKLVKEVSADFVVGNLGTFGGVEDAVTTIDRVDAVRAGLGSGSACLTTELTRAGAPTLYAVAEASSVLKKYGLDVPVIADGGIRSPGDAALALAAGGSTVMMGNMFAGCSESPGELIKVGGKYYKPYRGMGSASARAKRFALDRYSQPSKAVAEGVEGVVPYRGDVEDVVEEFVGGLRAAFGYVGARNIQELWEKAVFGSVSAAGMQELKPHDIVLPGEEKV